MCIICVDLNKGKLTTTEALTNLKEIIDQIDEVHFVEVLDLISEKEEENETN
jgi:hypothetical protein